MSFGVRCHETGMRKRSGHSRSAHGGFWHPWCHIYLHVDCSENWTHGLFLDWSLLLLLCLIWCARRAGSMLDYLKLLASQLCFLIRPIC